MTTSILPFVADALIATNIQKVFFLEILKQMLQIFRVIFLDTLQSAGCRLKLTVSKMFNSLAISSCWTIIYCHDKIWLFILFLFQAVVVSISLRMHQVDLVFSLTILMNRWNSGRRRWNCYVYRIQCKIYLYEEMITVVVFRLLTIEI